MNVRDSATVHVCTPSRFDGRLGGCLQHRNQILELFPVAVG